MKMHSKNRGFNRSVAPLIIGMTCFSMFAACVKKGSEPAAVNVNPQLQAKLEKKIEDTFKFDRLAPENVKLSQKFLAASLIRGKDEKNGLIANVEILLKDEGAAPISVLASGPVDTKEIKILENKSKNEVTYKVEAKCVRDACEEIHVLLTETETVPTVGQTSAVHYVNTDAVAAKTDEEALAEAKLAETKAAELKAEKEKADADAVAAGFIDMDSAVAALSGTTGEVEKSAATTPEKSAKEKADEEARKMGFASADAAKGNKVERKVGMVFMLPAKKDATPGNAKGADVKIAFDLTALKMVLYFRTGPDAATPGGSLISVEDYLAQNIAAESKKAKADADKGDGGDDDDKSADKKEDKTTEKKADASVPEVKVKPAVVTK
ncbi:MAG: hypothetical protein V4692_07950 [Bdellovibrionota bacterium]